MRGDAFIHFVCGSRRVNIRLGVVLLILKSPQSLPTHNLPGRPVVNRWFLQSDTTLNKYRAKQQSVKGNKERRN